jgi:3-hydroxyacyl-CoA dehydrogenase
MINEAIETLYNKVAGVYEIDTVMKLGMGHPMGPLQLADFIGLDVCLAILNVMYDFKTLICPLPTLSKYGSQERSQIYEGFYERKQKSRKISNNLSSLKNPRAEQKMVFAALVLLKRNPLWLKRRTKNAQRHDNFLVTVGG